MEWGQTLWVFQKQHRALLTILTKQLYLSPPRKMCPSTHTYYKVEIEKKNYYIYDK